MKISAKSHLCLIIGDPIEHSLSPQMHNAAYERLGIDDQFVFVAAKVSISNIEKVAQTMRVMNIRGMTCTMPHKQEILKYLDTIDPVAQKIGAVNTVVNENGKLLGYNTDWLGVVTPLERYGALKGKRAAIIGAGGAARAAVFGLLKQEAEVTIFNRTITRSDQLAKEFGCLAKGFDALANLKEFDIIFNATPVGNTSLVPADYLTSSQIVFDAMYYPYQTELLKSAQTKGATVIHGTEMLLHQGTEQFSLYTGHKAPEEVMRKVIMENIQ